jgi:hypothetical protein
MYCTRCKGPVVSERFEDLLDDTGVLRFAGWRCLTCGEVWDPVILSNRISPRPPRQRPRPGGVLGGP